jgi:ATP-dependent Lon protease
LQPNWEALYSLKPAIAQTVCIGKIISHSPTEDNRHNILLVGVKRARVVQELKVDKLYRIAEVDVLEDRYSMEESLHRPELQAKLQDLFLHFVPDGLAAQESFKQLVGKQLPLGILTDTITYAMNLPVAIKLQLLAEENVDIRCRILTRCLQQKLEQDEAQRDNSATSPAASKFPPPFSEN